MTNIISARHVNKKYGKKQVLSDINFTAERGEVIGIVGTNGAGKTTFLKSLLGLTRASGEINVCGLNPYTQQHQLTENVSFIADTAILPKWITCQQLLAYMAEMHPNFCLADAETFLANTLIKPEQKVKQMSKGMVVQLHLALVTAIKSTLLVLDEPTLGLDIIRRKEFYNLLMESYFDNNNTILITTHQIEEIEQILTRAVFVDQGRILLDIKLEDFEQRFCQVSANAQYTEQLDNLKPIYKQQTLSGIEYIFDTADKTRLAEYGQVKIPRLEDVFVAIANAQKEVTYA